MYSKKSRKKKMITISIIIFLSLFLLLYSLSSSRKLGPLESFFKDTSILIQKAVMFPFTYLNSEKEKDASKENTQIYGGILQMLWINNIAKLTESNSILELQRPVELNIEDWIANDNKQYYLCLDANEQINKNSDKYKIIYEKENAIILEKTNI